QIFRPAVRRLCHAPQVLRHADEAADLVLDVVDQDLDGAVALPLARGLAAGALLLALPRVRVLVGAPVLVAQAQDADRRRRLGLPGVHAPVHRDGGLASRDRALD